MNTLVLVLAAILVAFLSGCASAATASKSHNADATMIQGVLDKMLPPDFAGPVEVSHVNQYFTINIKAGNVHRNTDGKWTWDWLEYERTSHFPIFSGLTWSSTGKIRLGTPQTAPVVK